MPKLENAFLRPTVKARKVLRSEGDVYRFDVAADTGHTETSAYELLRLQGCGPAEARGILTDAMVAAARETVFPL